MNLVTKPCSISKVKRKVPLEALTFDPREPNALASGAASCFGPRVARSSGILLMPNASANGSLV